MGCQGGNDLIIMLLVLGRRERGELYSRESCDVSLCE